MNTKTKIFYIAAKAPDGGIHWKPCNLDAANFKKIELIQLGSVGETESDLDNLDMMRGVMDDGNHAVLLGIYENSKSKIIINSNN